jgi:excinuclease ABC subunit C
MQKPDLSLFPDEPGVYLYKDAAGRILYVGKARRLRRRLASYFREGLSVPAKTRAMLEHARSIDILRTGTEKEALLLEASLIKKHRPRFNIVLRDDKDYLLFRISEKHPYPRVEVIRRRGAREHSGKAHLFGPFSSGLAARETWKLIHRYFPLRRCRDTVFANRTRPCLYYDMGQCLGPCVLPVPREEYQALVAKVMLLLSGKSRELIDRLQEEMKTAASDLRFEDAARLRDQLKAVERTVERQSVVLEPGRDIDLIGVAQEPEGLALGVVFVRDGLLLDGSNFFWPGLLMEDMPELLSGFLSQYYFQRQGLGESIPPRIVLPWLPDQSADDADDDGAVLDVPALEEALGQIRGASVRISGPRSPAEDSLMLMAAGNAREAVKNRLKSSLADLLARKFHASRPVRRIEVVDISHTGGVNTRAGMVVFEDERPVKEDYRAYALDQNLRDMGAESGDDYAALTAWATRRAGNGPPWADLVLIDGGKGQLAAVYAAFANAQVPTGTGEDDSFILASIAKARDEEGKADRRAGNVSDRIFLPGRSNPLSLAPGSPELLYLQRVRDAAHDFVLGRHRKARAAAALSGELTRVPGVGPKLARQLFEQFGSLAAMAAAGEEGLAKTPGVGKTRAKAIADRLAMLVGTETEHDAP